MRITRRRFLAGVAAIPLTWTAVRESPKLEDRNSKFASSFDFPVSSFGSSRACGLLDLHGHCEFPESLLGYRAALAEGGVPVVCVTSTSPAACQVLIIPAAFEITPYLARAVRVQLAKGGRVLLESGAAFARPEEFREHRAMLRKEFGIAVESPADLARGGCGRGRIPYMDYDWPLAVKVRDFSRVVPVDAPAREVIGRASGLPVALRRRVGRGSLVFLGSPLGPALWAGDAEARRWLGEIVAKA